MEVIDDRALSQLGVSKSFHQAVDEIEHRILLEGDKPYASVVKQLKVLYELTQFEFGRFLLLQQGCKSFWRYYLLTHPWNGRKTGLNSEGKPFTRLEKFILEESPTVLASQERLFISLNQAQRFVKNNAQLCSMPCGLMGELLYLDYMDISQIGLTGIDADAETILLAKKRADEKKLLQWCHFEKQDYSQVMFNSQFDFLVSYSFNMYEPDPNKLTAFYRKAYEALKPGGVLLSSFLTYPPGFEQASEWDLVHVNREDFLQQKIVFMDILQVGWQCYQTSDEFRACLEGVGFRNLQFIYDHARMFPTVIAHR